MRAIDKHKRSTDEIVAEIVEKCGDTSVEGFVRTLMSGLSGLCIEYPPLTGNRAVNKKYAKKLSKQIDELEDTLKIVPEGFPLQFLFAPERFVSLLFLAQFPAGQGATVQIDPKEIETFAEEAETRHGRLTEELAKLRAQCDRIIELRLGEHGSAGYPQERAAIASRELMERCGLPLTCSPTSAYCRVASLLFEEMTGQFNVDLRRECERMAHSPLCTEKPPRS
jgi:hypothetical protein